MVGFLRAAETFGGLEDGFEQFIERGAGVGEKLMASLGQERARSGVYACIAKFDVIFAIGTLPYVLLLDAEAEREIIDQAPGQRHATYVEALPDECSEGRLLVG